jgi:protocatechuate 3,4-dioxygenase beta subunit
MRPAENIKKLIKNAPIKTNPAVNEAVLKDLLNELDKSKKNPSATLQPNIWKIIMKSRITQLTTAAVIIIAVLVGINFLNGTTSWAKIIKAFNEVENVHFSSTTFGLDGTKTEYHMYLKRPDCFYEDSADRIIIDNGKERLTIDKEKKTAQFSDSFLPYQPLEKHYMFKQIDIFRSENQNEYEITKIDEESSDTTLVFNLHYKSHTTDLEIKCKAWVEADTMLPLKMRVELVSEPGENEPARGEIVFDYKQIPDEVFALIVPEGYKQLPRKQRGVLSGKVLDENERPVVHAIVYCVDRAGVFSEQTTTDESGQFTFKLPPEGMGTTPIWLPLMFRAFAEDNPNTVAWSVIKDPASKAEPGGNIPYEVGYVENKGCILKSATEIILRMEPAGTIAGEVTDEDGNPIRNAKVRLHRCALADKYGNTGLTGIDVHKWSGPGDAGIVRTDENGRYELNNLPRFWKKTRFFVRAEAEGFVGDTTSFRPKGPMEYKELNFQLYKTGITVRGTLIDNYGEPLNERMMSASVNGKYYRSCRTKTDSDGEFTLLNCPITGDLQVKAELSYNHWPSHERKRYNSYVYYPDVIKGIDYQQGHLEYEIKMVAVLPELVLNVEVKNTDGILLKYFPVEIRGDAGTISGEWRADKKLTRRTDENGRCTFTEVPDVKDLRLVLHGGETILNEKLSDRSKKFVAENRKKYFWAEVPVKIVEGQKEYNITAVALTRQEYRKQEAEKNR